MYQHHTTTSPTISLQQIYEEADLFNPEMVAQLREALLTTPTVEHDRLRRLFRFVGEGLLRRNLLPLDQELAHYYDQLSWPNTWAEHDVLSPNLHVPTQPDADRLAVLIGVYNQRWQFLNAQLTDLGLGNVLSFYELITNIDPITLLHSAEEFLDETDNAYQGALAAWAAAPDDRWQLEAALGGDAYQLLFPAAELVPTIEDTLYHLTIDVTKLPNLLLEVNRQLAPGLALAFPVRVPEEIYACVFPAAGIAAYEELLGVVGMIMPILLLNPKQTWMHRRLLDPAIQVACAELFTQLVTNSTWRADLLGDEADDPQLQQLCELRRLYRLRRAAARVIYAVDRILEQADYAAVFQRALGVRHDQSAQIIDMGHMRYSFDTWRGLRTGHSFAHQLEDYFGSAWYRDNQCGQMLRQLFSNGLTSLQQLRLAELQH